MLFKNTFTRFASFIRKKLGGKGETGTNSPLINSVIIPTETQKRVEKISSKQKNINILTNYPRPLLELNDERLLKLQTCNDDTVPFLDFHNTKFLAKVVNCYDGDTIRLAFFLGPDHIYKYNCRMNKYDCPEMKPRKPKTVELGLEEKRMAILAKDYISNLILDKIVYVEVSGKGNGNDLYGRPLVDVYTSRDSKKSVNDEMIEKRYGYPYKGDTKIPFEELIDWYRGETSFAPPPQTP